MGGSGTTPDWQRRTTAEIVAVEDEGRIIQLTAPDPNCQVKSRATRRRTNRTGNGRWPALVTKQLEAGAKRRAGRSASRSV